MIIISSSCSNNIIIPITMIICITAPFALSLIQGFHDRSSTVLVLFCIQNRHTPSLKVKHFCQTNLWTVFFTIFLINNSGIREESAIFTVQTLLHLDKEILKEYGVGYGEFHSTTGSSCGRCRWSGTPHHNGGVIDLRQVDPAFLSRPVSLPSVSTT